MSVVGKWVEGLSPLMPLDEAWRLILKARIGAVSRAYALAIETVGDSEPIHQLRVACRRADAALSIEDTLPKRKTNSLRRDIRKLRRLAGQVRNADVLLERLATVPGNANLASCALAGWTMVGRRKSRYKLEKRKKPAQRIEVVGEAVQEWKLHSADETLANRAAKVIPKELESLTASLQNSQDAVALHQARIVGKQLRYDLELFMCCCNSDVFAEVYGMLERIQDLLGTMNDLQLALECAAAFSKELESLPPSVNRRMLEELATIVQEWSGMNSSLRDQVSHWLLRWQLMKPAERLMDLPASASNPGAA